MIIKTYHLTFLVTLISLSSTIAFANLKDAQTAFKSGNWKVLRSIDSMKDTVECTGVYKDNYGVQLTNDTLYVSVRGGLESVTLRFGDKPARSMRLAEKAEKDLRSIIISGTDFTELIESDRLRIQALTLVGNITNEDFDLSTIKDVLDSIRGGCPVQVSAAPTENLEKPLLTVSDKSIQPTCSDVILSRMKVQGLKEKQIRAICK